MSALINSVGHALAVAASDVVKSAKFVETSVLPVLKSAQAKTSPPSNPSRPWSAPRRPILNEPGSPSSGWSSTPSMPLARLLVRMV
jgi:hypothetical protein